MISIILQKAKQRLKIISETPSLDAQVLLAHVINQKKAWLFAHPEAVLTQQEKTQYEKLLTRLEKGEALPYVLGEWEFFGHPFWITPDVLIPRPETELLVERAIHWLKGKSKGHHLVDVGTGSGIIPICIAKNFENLKITAIDISKKALMIAKRNIERHDLTERINLIQNDLLNHTEMMFDLITANLPYIPTETLKDLAVYKTEPTLALDGGADGLALIRRLLKQASKNLISGGLILLEIEYRQGEIVRELALLNFPNAKVKIIPDLSGHDRLIEIQT